MSSLRFFAGALSLCSAVVCANAQTQTASYTYNDHPLYIAPASANAATSARISVPAGLTIASVTVQLNLQYPNVGDLQVALFSAQGTRTVLLSNNCSGLANVNTTFDDAAATKYSTFCPQEAGRGPFRAEEPLSNSKGEFSGGYWQIVVQNTKSDSNSGLLLNFGVTITGTPVTQPSFGAQSIVNAASGINDGVVAPGELISIYGVALGPQTGVAAAATPLATSLGGTTVTFDGTPVPILYSSYYQVDIQAPFTLTPGSTTQVRIQTSGGTSGNIAMDVLSSAAGLFTNQTNGAGQLLAVNSDGSVNSASNPAAAGSYISLYATGLGAVTPAVAAGMPAPSTPPSTVNGGFVVVIAGQSASVQFAGLAPGYAGLYQINVQIPSAVPSGPRRVFVVAPNGYTSQSGAVIFVQ